MKAFATSERLAAEVLRGSWVVASGLRYTCSASNGCLAEAVSGEAWSAEGLPGLLLHPLGAWSSCATSGVGGGDISLAAGVLLDEGGASMTVVARRLVGGQLAAVELLTLTRA